MGVLTEDMTQLRNEILDLRSARQGLVQALERETEERRADVSQTLADFSKSFAARARKTKADRLGSLSNLKRTVDDLRTEVRTDLSSIRQAWRAVRTPARGAVEELASQPSEEVGHNVEELASQPSEEAGHYVEELASQPSEKPGHDVEELASQPSEEAGAYPEERPSETGGQPPPVGAGGEKPIRKKRKH